MKHLSWILCLSLFLNNKICTAGNTPAQITLFPQQQEQVIDGFGIAQARWADKLYEHHKRTEVMDLLFGKDGLCLSMLRGDSAWTPPAHMKSNGKDYTVTLLPESVTTFTGSIN